MEKEDELERNAIEDGIRYKASIVCLGEWKDTRRSANLERRTTQIRGVCSNGLNNAEVILISTILGETKINNLPSYSI